MTSWQELSDRFADKELPEPLERGVLDYIASLPENQVLLVACSGGADSVYLVLTALNCLPGARRRLQIVHFNHGLRGSESDADEAFVCKMATGLGIRCHVGRPEGTLAPDEAVLRDARYTWMSEIYDREDAGGLLLGHHADDLVESLLMAVLTGSGPAGLSSPVPVKRFADGQVRLRPMLSLQREAIERCLGSASIPWREDSSNKDTAFTRNWLRHECIPQLRRRIPQDIHAGTRRTRQLMEECLTELDFRLESLKIDFSDPHGLDIRPLVGEPMALIRRALMSWWLRHYSNTIVGKGALETVLQQVQSGRSGGPFDIGSGAALRLDTPGLLRLDRSGLHVTANWNSVVHWNWSSGPLYLPDGAFLQAERVSWSREDPAPYRKADPQTSAWIRWDGQVLRVRSWQPGDRYQPLGAPGRRKLQDMFVDAKVPTERKHELPVILDGDDAILWVPGFAPSEPGRVTGACESALKLTYHHQSAGLI